MNNTVNIGDTLFDAFGGLIERMEVTETRNTAKGVMVCAVGAMSENEFPQSEIGNSIFRTWDEAAKSAARETGRVMFVSESTEL